MRQALAGHAVVEAVLLLRPRHLAARAPAPTRCALRRGAGTRNEAWFHMVNHDVISMPDKWEYPWYAAWDLAFHCVPLAMVDPDFAKGQLDLMLSQRYLHPTGQIPAYEWNFGDVNPPVHAFATLFVYTALGGRACGDGRRSTFLRRVVHQAAAQLHLVGEPQGPHRAQRVRGRVPRPRQHRGVRPQRRRCPTGGRLEQADGTAWMALFSQNMLELALVLAEHDPAYEDFVLKFVEHFFWIAAAIDPIGEHPDEMWDEEDGFFYDVLRLPDGTRPAAQGALARRAAAAVRHHGHRARASSSGSPALGRAGPQLPRPQPRPARPTSPTRSVPGVDGRRLLSLVNEDKLRRILARMLDEERFLGPTASGRSRAWHLDHPYTLRRRRRPSTGCSTSRPSRPPACSAATPTGGARCGSRSTC